ncbi:MAG: ATP-binding cassette domain-containing protein [Paucimonas sp.]|jgi:putative ABC transport system ATP-binding protein|nr:ATP-binding cassette domain-containing protein [Paucimonas sp.]
MTPLLEARALARIDPERHGTLLAPTDFTLAAGERVAIIGASGSGKSVFLRALALLDAPSGGSVIWQQQSVGAQRITQYRACVCYLAQRPALADGTVLDNLRLPFTLASHRARAFDRDAATALLLQAGKSADFLDHSAADLSGGEAQIVALVRVLQLAPQVILFDEPTAALDPQSAAAVERLVTDWFEAAPRSRAFAWVTHDTEQARRLCTRRLTMHQGVLQP